MNDVLNEDFISTHSTRGRLLNPRLRSEASNNIANRLPAFLSNQKHELENCVCSRKLTIMLSGSTLVGVSSQEESDVDVVVFSDQVDEELNKKYCEQTGRDSEEQKGYKNPQDFQEYLDNYDRILSFNIRSNFDDTFKTNIDGFIVRVPSLLHEISNMLSILQDGGIVPSAYTKTLFCTMLLFASEPVYQTSSEQITQYREQLVSLLASSKQGERIWNWIRVFFNKFVVNYENNSAFNPLKDVIDRHGKRVENTFDEILGDVEATTDRDRIKSFLRNSRDQVQLPVFQDLLRVLPTNNAVIPSN